MTETSGAASQWSIGELAKAYGVTVRALHHYDEIGLLSAGQRTASGHRRYTEEDVRRLYRIRSLQMLGLPLAEIGAVLGTPADDMGSLRALLERQLLHLRQHAEQVQAVQDRIRDLLSRIDGAAMPAPEQFMATLEMITMLENYFTPEQRQELAGRRAELGSDSIDAAKVRWAALVEEGLRHVENGTPVTDPSIREWARVWDEIGSMFHRGEETKAAARSMWQDNKTALSADLPWTPEQLAGLVAYLQKARTQP
ncbi:DNA-binding transcriptional regulator, MerR family [Arthrobacter sp. 49Tsu3.1M3]|uniref:MerR family transcriptional regulator n=1 Tax=Arthrobacter sp. 49Tsu3.1M3 TaxID=1279029 RepID=UPI0009A844E3|nr:MerR family transcriptional regulator [Arthrobacter sp. 49Tsu3.1M3]SKB31380.1 DNA-binding transcriptional regulator, MerR family [Arthrobacter sp. 49Tsu3.1M3]